MSQDQKLLQLLSKNASLHLNLEEEINNANHTGFVCKKRYKIEAGHGVLCGGAREPLKPGNV